MSSLWKYFVRLYLFYELGSDRFFVSGGWGKIVCTIVVGGWVG